jgi:hypothetical protein
VSLVYALHESSYVAITMTCTRTYMHAHMPLACHAIIHTHTTHVLKVNDMKAHMHAYAHIHIHANANMYSHTYTYIKKNRML